MASEDQIAPSIEVSTAGYAMTTQERAFVDGVLEPRFRTNLAETRQFTEEYLTNAFAAARSELSGEVSKIRDLLKTQATSLRGEFLTRMDDKLATFVTTFPSSSRADPPLMHDVSFSGDSQYLDSFLYSVYDALAAHSSAFSDNDRRIKWISRHLKPVGSPAADWWLSLVAENASLFYNVILEGKTAAYPFRLASLRSVDAFLDELVSCFADPFAAQKALKSLQDFSMGKLGVQKFNVKFNSLSYRVKGLSEPILMDYYQRALSERVRRQAMNRPDWGPCQSTKALQAVTLLASKQLEDITTANKPLFPSMTAALLSSMVPVPRDHSAMDVDIHAASARLARPPTPSVVSFGFYRELCHQRNLCWRCLKTYDEVHRARKLVPSQPPCPNLPVDAIKMDQFAAHCQSHPLPTPASLSSLQTAGVAMTPVPVPAGASIQEAVASPSPAGLFYGGQAMYHAPLF